VDFGIRIEFQARDSPHAAAHCVIVKDAPKFGINEDSEVCSFIEKYIPVPFLKRNGN